MPRLLLIDGEPAETPKQLRRAFSGPTYCVSVARTGAGGLERTRAKPPDVLILNLELPDRPGLDIYRAIRRLDAEIPVIFTMAAKTTDEAIDAMKLGAFDCLFKPFEFHQLERIVRKALNARRQMRDPVIVSKTRPDSGIEAGLIGSCPCMCEVYKAIGRVAAQNVPVLITGESGTGKELVALALYHHSARARASFRTVNCAAIPETLLESEMFGHEKGSFTDAIRRRIGKFEQCDGGTLFFDEIGEMPPALQAKILRLLQEQTFERVGGNEVVRTNVRLIAATNRDLKEDSANGRFRSDLYYRLSVFTIHLPPLRERGDDLSILVQYFLHRFSVELKRDAGRDLGRGFQALREYHWPGNVRELQSVLKQALVRSSGAGLGGGISS